MPHLKVHNYGGKTSSVIPAVPRQLHPIVAQIAAYCNVDRSPQQGRPGKLTQWLNNAIGPNSR